jgi:hypothetical protein
MQPIFHTFHKWECQKLINSQFKIFHSYSRFLSKSYDNFVWNLMRRESLHPLNAHMILEGFQKRRRHPCQWKITLKGVLHDLFLQSSSFSLSC